MAFVLLIFAMASSVLLAAAPVRHAQQMGFKMVNLTNPEWYQWGLWNLEWIWLFTASEVFASVPFMLFGLWFLWQAKSRSGVNRPSSGLSGPSQVKFHLLLAGTLFALGPTSSLLTQALVTPSAYGVAGHEQFWFWPVFGLRTVGLIGLGLVLLTFPNGRLETRFERLLARVWTVLCVAFFLFPSLPLNIVYGSDRPEGLGLALPVNEWLGTFGRYRLYFGPFGQDNLVIPASTIPLLIKLEPFMQIGLVLGFLLLMLVAQIFRYRRSTSGLERQQLRWGWLGQLCLHLGSFIYFGHAASLRVLAEGAGESIFAYALATFAAAIVSSGFSVCLAIALARPALFESRVFSRSSLTYLALTGLSLFVFVLVVSGIGPMLGLSDRLPLGVFSVALALLLVVVLRDGLQSASERLWGRSEDPFLVLTKLRTDLEVAREPELILADAARIVASNLRLPFVRIVALRSDSSSPDAASPALQTLAETGSPGLEVQQFAFMSNGEQVGYLEITPRGSDDPLTRAELCLLETVVGQLGSAARTLMLNEELRRANLRLLQTRNEERQRLRYELHDGVLGSLSGVCLKLGALEAGMGGNPDKSVELVQHVLRDLKHTQSDVRRLVNGLHASALEELGLQGSLQRYQGAYGSLKIQVNADGLGTTFLPRELEAVALRIAQEAITNVIKHASAQSCLVSLRSDGLVLHLEIEDDGVGLPETNHLALRGEGLRSMHERASRAGGRLELQSLPRSGTRVRAVLPFNPQFTQQVLS